MAPPGPVPKAFIRTTQFFPLRFTHDGLSVFELNSDGHALAPRRAEPKDFSPARLLEYPTAMIEARRPGILVKIVQIIPLMRDDARDNDGLAMPMRGESTRGYELAPSGAGKEVLIPVTNRIPQRNVSNPHVVKRDGFSQAEELIAKSGSAG